MKRQITKLGEFLVLLLTAATFGYSTTVTANLNDLTGAALSSQASVSFELVNMGTAIPRVSGTGIIVKSPVIATPNGAGLVSVNIIDNTTIIPAGTYYRVCVFNAGVKYRCNYYNITGGSVDLSALTPIGTAPVVTPPTGDTVYLRTDAGNTNLAGIAPFTFGTLNGLEYAGSFSGATPQLKWNAAITNYGANPGVVIGASPGLSGTVATSEPSTIPDNVAIWDFRDKGRLQIRTNPTAITSGGAAALSIIVGDPAFSTNNPSSTTPVLAYLAMRTANFGSLGGGSTVLNTEMQCDAATHIFCTSAEVDQVVLDTVDNAGAVYTSKLKSNLRLAYGSVNPGFTPGTRGDGIITIDATPQSPGAYYGITVPPGLATNAFIKFVGPQVTGIQVGAGGYTAPSTTLNTTYNLGGANCTGSEAFHSASAFYVSGGGNTESNSIASMGCTATSAFTLSAGFAHNYSAGATLTPIAGLYAFNAIGDASNQATIFANAWEAPCNLQYYQTAGVTSCNIINNVDNAGVERTLLFLNSSDNSVHLRSPGGNILIEDKTGAAQGTITISNGAYTATGQLASTLNTNQMVFGTGGNVVTLNIPNISGGGTIATPAVAGTLSLGVLQDCGLTSGATQNCGNTVKTLPFTVIGRASFNTATTQAIGTLPFTSSSSYTCNAQDVTTAAGVVNATTYTSGASVTFTETNGVNTDSFRYVCVGF